MQETKTEEITVKEVFEEVQQKLEEKTGPNTELRGFDKFMCDMVVEAIKHELDKVNNQKDLLIVLGREFGIGLTARLALVPPENVDEELNKLFDALRKDIHNNIGRTRRFFNP